MYFSYFYFIFPIDRLDMLDADLTFGWKSQRNLWCLFLKGKLHSELLNLDFDSDLSVLNLSKDDNFFSFFSVQLILFCFFFFLCFFIYFTCKYSTWHLGCIILKSIAYLSNFGLWPYSIETLVPVWSSTLSNIKPGRYLDGWLLGNWVL